LRMREFSENRVACDRWESMGESARLRESGGLAREDAGGGAVALEPRDRRGEGGGRGAAPRDGGGYDRACAGETLGSG